ncbi:MAG TPA: hypothetical protein VGR88_05160, partial [Ktedonobacterales bacterium]|nr:hypothetical protein [Ktedonobacterales bacterium]
MRRYRVPVLVALVALLSASALAFVMTPAFVAKTAHAQSAQRHSNGVTVTPDSHHDVSAPLSTIAGHPSPATAPHQADAPVHVPLRPEGPANNQHAEVQSHIGPYAAPTASNNFDGVGNGFTGPQGTFSVSAAPPDTNGAVGPQDYVQTVNTDFAVFNKDASRGAVGTVRYGPVQINTLWSGFGGLCQTDNDGDPTVVYDGIANRWVISQFAVTGATSTYYQCVAVSTTSDPTGSYNRYSFPYSNF